MPATREVFRPRQKGRDGFWPYCRECYREINRGYMQRQRQGLGRSEAPVVAVTDREVPLLPPYASHQEAELAAFGIPLSPTQLERYRDCVAQNPAGGNADDGPIHYSRKERDLK